MAEPVPVTGRDGRETPVEGARGTVDSTCSSESEVAMSRRSIRAAGAALLVAAAAACGQSPAAGSAAPPAVFCERLHEVMDLSVEIKHQQGFPRLVAVYESAIAVAPSDLVTDLTTLMTYYRSGYRAPAPSGPDPHDASKRLTAVWRHQCP